MKQVWIPIVICSLAAGIVIGCRSDTGQKEWVDFYQEKIAAVLSAANALAAANNTEQAAREMEKGFKALREAVAQEEFLINKYPRVVETPEIHKLQEDYLAASDKFAREVEALPKRLVVDRVMIEALKKMQGGFKPSQEKSP